MGDIYPTHTCFDDAVDLLTQLMEHGNPPDRFRLVHAICTAPDGHLYAHAWAEDLESGRAMFDGIQDGERHHFATPLDEYRETMNIVESVSYTIREAWAENAKFNDYGPWIEHYRQLCGGRDEWIIGQTG